MDQLTTEVDTSLNEQAEFPSLASVEKSLSGVINEVDVYFDGRDFCEFLPSAGASSTAQHGLLLDPASQAGNAYAMYVTTFADRFDEVNALEARILLDVQQAAAGNELFLMLPDYSSERWQPFPLEFNPESGLFEAEFGSWEGHYSYRNVLVFAVLASGSETRTVQSLRIGSSYTPELKFSIQRDSRQAVGTAIDLNITIKDDNDPQFGKLSSVDVDFDNDGSVDMTAIELPKDVTGNRFLASGWVIPGPGEHELRVIVRSASGITYEAVETYFHGTEATLEPQAELGIMTQVSGRPDEVLTFDASSSTAGDAPITKYIWSVDGQKVLVTTDPSFAYSFSNPGEYRVNLTVVDELFNTGFDFQYVVITETDEHWDYTQPEPDNHYYHDYLSNFYAFSEIKGRPALAAYDPQQVLPMRRIVYLRSDDNKGSSWPELASTVASTDDMGDLKVVGLQEIDNRPVVFYLRRTDSEPVNPWTLCKRSALDYSGSAWEPEIVCLEFPEEPWFVQMLMLGDRPCLLENGGESGASHALRVASDSDGESWQGPFALPGYVDENYPKVLDWNGKPCVAFDSGEDDTVKFIRAEDENGTAWGDPLVIIDGSSSFAELLDMEIVNGRPAVIARSNPPACPYLDKYMAYVSCLDETGELWSEPVYLYGKPFDRCAELLELDGLPAIAWIGHDSQTDIRLNIQVARDATGSAWLPETVLPYDGLNNDYYQYGDGRSDFDDQFIIKCSGTPVAILNDFGGTIAWFE